MVEINPLSLIGRSNDPSLTPRTVQANKALLDLQSGNVLQTLTNRGAMNRQNVSDTSAFARTLAPMGFTPESFTPNAANRLRRGIEALRGAQTTEANVGGGVRIPGGTPAFLPEDTLKQKVKPGFTLPGEAQSFALPKLTSTTKAGGSFETVEVDPKTGILGKRIRTEGSEQKAQSQGGTVTTQRVNELHTLVTDMLTARGISYETVEIVSEDATHITISIDGGNPIPVKKDTEE